MSNRTIETLAQRIENSNLSKKEKNELMSLLKGLSEHIEKVAEQDGDKAESIENFTRISAHEVLRKEQKPELITLSIEGLKQSVEDFEASHPELVRIVNRISIMLSDIGI